MSEWATGLLPKYLLLEQPLAHVALIRLNRPDTRNALSMAVRREIAVCIHQAERCSDIRAIILAGNDRCFASGGDIKENSTLGVVDAIYRGWEKKDLWAVLSRCRKPIVAAVRGYALGGGAELMMLADIIVASEVARIGQPEVNVGIIPGSGGTQRLPRAVGKYQAMRIVLTGGWISGLEASRIGLVSEAIDDEQVETRAVEVAASIAENAPLATSFAKEAILIGDDSPLEVGLAHEHKAFLLLTSTEDFKEGIQSFLEKRKPQFIGR
jgi:enoyl-CoA hydratase